MLFSWWSWGGVSLRCVCARLVVSVHDVAPASAAETARWCADADGFGIPVSLLVIPGPWRGASLAGQPDYASFLRERRDGGDEIMVHGWSHRAGPEGGWPRRALGRAVARGAAEFAALDVDEAAAKLRAANAVMAESGLSTTGFTPPGWLASPAAERALRAAGFSHTTDHFGAKDLRTGRRHRGFALSHRPGDGWSERFGAAMLETLARRNAARGGLVRLALHPDDLHHPGLREATLRAIDAALQAGAHATTYADLVEATVK
ncbi:polysaccharide deacetylase family protein [Nocardia colli]|uniref:polysaccharide deacetylase family protein n=1 Tax=Nocardia colli TaxID=2545717 RepID=UPI00295F1DDA|nr:polysaccharide deacetylase family protein [Nocardia colli]